MLSSQSGAHLLTCSFGCSVSVLFFAQREQCRVVEIPVPGLHLGHTPGRIIEVRISRRGVQRAIDLGPDHRVFQDRPTRCRGPDNRQLMSGIRIECIYGLTRPKIVVSNRLTREQGITGMNIVDVPCTK